MNRLGPLAGSLLALAAAACAPTEPAAPATSPDPMPSLAATVPGPSAAPSNPELRDRLQNAANASVAGERLNVELLRSFYARHGFAPVWASREAQAKSFIDAVMHADDHGLSPQLFHADLLRSADTLPALDRELLLSDAFLSYADALARGAVPIERRRDDEVLAPEPVDVAAKLDAALGSGDPAASLEALAPTTPTYRVLRQALRDSRAGAPVRGKSASNRSRDIEVNLERERWLPRRLPADRVWVNVADERLVMYQDDRPVFSSKVIVGRAERSNQSPELQASIDAIWFNPPWTIPQDIVTNEIMPVVAKDPTYLARHNMSLMPDGSLQQRAGSSSALGELMFEMKNGFDVYLHDTPGKNLFSLSDRRISHGCIRVEDPHTLAALVMRQPIESIRQTIAPGDTSRRLVPKPVPVFVVYKTAFVDADDRLQFRADIYGRDAEIWQQLDPRGRAATVERGTSGPRGI